MAARKPGRGWAPERITQWRWDLDTYTSEVNERRARQRGTVKGVGNKINRVDAYVGAPRPSKVMVWTPALTKCFLERAERHPWYVLDYVIAFRAVARRRVRTALDRPGLGRGDRDDPLAVHPDRPRQLRKQPKTDAGEATISLDASTVVALRAHKARQNTMRLAARDAWHHTGLVFTDHTGQRLRPNEVTDQFERLSMEAGLPPVRLHDLRHGAASFLLAAGHDMKTVQEALRLSSLAADTYTSCYPRSPANPPKTPPPSSSTPTPQQPSPPSDPAHPTHPPRRPVAHHRAAGRTHARDHTALTARNGHHNVTHGRRQRPPGGIAGREQGAVTPTAGRRNRG
ncbi:tyrosine-type recombinase/integrase [Actinomadura logoneensis]|nr:tyrosine-type recombinase/integrase [Actinomadura logoneensis]